MEFYKFFVGHNRMRICMHAVSVSGKIKLSLNCTVNCISNKPASGICTCQTSVDSKSSSRRISLK